MRFSADESGVLCRRTQPQHDRRFVRMRKGWKNVWGSSGSLVALRSSRHECELLQKKKVELESKEGQGDKRQPELVGCRRNCRLYRKRLAGSSRKKRPSHGQCSIRASERKREGGIDRPGTSGIVGIKNQQLAASDNFIARLDLIAIDRLGHCGVDW